MGKIESLTYTSFLSLSYLRKILSFVFVCFEKIISYILFINNRSNFESRKKNISMIALMNYLFRKLRMLFARIAICRSRKRVENCIFSLFAMKLEYESR